MDHREINYRKETERYLHIHRANETLYGGNQNCFASGKLSGFGCGLIAAADTSLILRGIYEISWADYEAYVKKIQRYFFYLPRFGMNGSFLAIGINHVFHKYGIPARAHWCLKPMSRVSFDSMRSMLRQGIPVVIAVGPNFPNVAGKKRLNFYHHGCHEEEQKAGSMHKHFVVVTDMTEDFMTISSWGKRYKIRCQDYLNYCTKNSMFLFSNFLKISLKY